MNNPVKELPLSFRNQMALTLGADFNNFIDSLKETTPVSIRLNTSKHYNPDNLPQIPWCAAGRYLSERPVFTLDPLIHGGAYYVQEASSMFLEQALIQTTDLTQSLNVLDLCAAPGGKTTHLLDLINKDSLLVSNEVIRSRATVLSENLQKWGRCNSIVTNNDPQDFTKLKGFFDVIVVDAPCSGEGLFRKDPAAVNEWSEDNVALCWKRQRRILNDIWPALKTGGVLIYSTCTYNKFENEDNLKWLKDEHDAAFLTIKTDSLWGVTEVNENDIKGYHFYPHRVKGEGFFMAAVRKTSPEEPVRVKQKNTFFQRTPAKISEQLLTWVKHEQNELALLLWKDTVLMIPSSKLAEVEFIVQKLHIISTGTAMAEIKHEKLIPMHALALDTLINTESFSVLSTSKEQALQYLRKETMQVELPKKGFALITFENIPLGWANVLDNRINNMYPQHWRIRMSGT